MGTTKVIIYVLSKNICIHSGEARRIFDELSFKIEMLYLYGVGMRGK